MKKTSKRRILIVGGATALSLLISAPAFAATATSSTDTKSSHVAGGTFAQAKRELLAHAVFGTVTAINGSTITLSHKTKDGTKNITVTTTSSTEYKMKGEAAVLSDVTVGEKIVAMGTKDSSGNLTDATRVRIFKKAS